MKKIIAWLKGVFDVLTHVQKQKEVYELLHRKIVDLDNLKFQYEEKIKEADVVYTTVKTFNSENGEKVFWPWVKSVLVGDEYKFLLFCLRESCYRELMNTSDTVRMHEINGQFKMLVAIDTYLTNGLREYEFKNKN